MLGVMINRRKAIIGYVTYFFTTRIVGRIVRKKAGDVVPGSSENGGTGMLNRTKAAPKAVAAKTAALAAVATPIVQRAISDPELHAAIRQAFDTGREVTTEVRGSSPKTTQKRVARDQKLLAKVETSAAELQKAVTAVVKEPEKKGFFRRVVTPLLVIGGVATAAWYAFKKFGESNQKEPPY
jgi:hypothetical protein